MAQAAENPNDQYVQAAEPKLGDEITALLQKAAAQGFKTAARMLSDGQVAGAAAEQEADRAQSDADASEREAAQAAVAAQAALQSVFAAAEWAGSSRMPDEVQTDVYVGMCWGMPQISPVH